MAWQFDILEATMRLLVPSGIIGFGRRVHFPFRIRSPEERACHMLDILLEADRRIAGADAGDPHAFYTLLHETAACISPVDAFYVALYSPTQQTLTFSYNVDDGIYDEPCTLPLGNGPTSWVIRHNAAIQWNSLEERDAAVLIPFGDTARPSHSAVHLPMRADAGEDAPLGVLSAQAYQPAAYDTKAVRLLQWLADQGGRALWSCRKARAFASTLEALERRQTLVTDRFVGILQDIDRASVALTPLVMSENRALLNALARLRRACHGHQTLVGQLALDAMEGGQAAIAASAPPHNAELSPREVEILRLLCSGASNAEIAEALFVSVNTVKFHCKGIFGKLGVRNRTEAARLTLPANLPDRVG